MSIRDRQREIGEEEVRPPKWPISIILLAALVVRLVGVGYCAGWSFDPSEERVVNRAFAHAIGFRLTKMLPENPDEPSLSTYVAAAEFGALYGAGHVFGRISSLVEYRHLFLTSRGILVVIARLSSVIFGVLSVYVVYLLAKNAFEWGVALLAAVFMAFSPQAIRFSQVATPDALALLFALVGLYYLVMLTTEKRFGTALRGAFLLGLAAGTAFQYAALAPIFVIIYLVVIPWEYKWSATVTGIVLCVALWTLGAALPNAPALFFFKDKMAAGFVRTAAAGVTADNMLAGGRALAALRELVSFDVFSIGALGWGLALLGSGGLVAGMAVLKWKRKRYFAVFVYLTVVFVAFFPGSAADLAAWSFLMTPALALGAGFLIYRLFWRKGMPAVLGIVLMVVFAALVAAQGLAAAGVSTMRRSDNDTRVIFARWAGDNLPNGAAVLTTEQARFLHPESALELATPRWIDWREKVLRSWGGKAFSVFVADATRGAGVPALETFQYVAVDTWSLERLERTASATPSSWRFAPAWRVSAAREILDAIESARLKGLLVNEIPAPVGRIGFYGPGIKVFELPQTPTAPEAPGQ